MRRWNFRAGDSRSVVNVAVTTTVVVNVSLLRRVSTGVGKRLTHRQDAIRGTRLDCCAQRAVNTLEQWITQHNAGDVQGTRVGYNDCVGYKVTGFIN